MTDDPLPNTPRHQVLFHVAYGDHQVTMLAPEVEARTVGAKMHCPAFRPERPDSAELFQIPCLNYAGEGNQESAIVIWDGGKRVSIPPLNDTPPTGGEDPHEFPRATSSARRQKAIFLTTGQIIDVCDGKPCVTD